jgi:hypothetical protein
MTCHTADARQDGQALDVAALLYDGQPGPITVSTPTGT